MDTVQPLRPIMRDAVYHYWAEKRKRAGKPFIRRLWAPTSASDQNPFGVFRCVCACGHHLMAWVWQECPLQARSGLQHKVLPRLLCRSVLG